MASQQQSRIQSYLEKNKIGPLFEVGLHTIQLNHSTSVCLTFRLSWNQIEDDILFYTPTALHFFYFIQLIYSSKLHHVKFYSDYLNAAEFRLPYAFSIR